jgi:hypothetical protein
MASATQMRGRPVRARRGLLAGAALILVLLVSGLLSIDRYRAPPPAPREALDRIAERNRRAAMIAAANQRAEAAAATATADSADETGQGAP